MGTLDYAVIAVYFAGMIGIGLWAMRQVGGQDDYFMGGRGFGRVMQTFAAFGAGTGAHEPVTVGRTGWTSGLSGVWSALMWLFVTPLYWFAAVWYRRMRLLTLGDWFVERYESRSLGASYALFAIVFYMFYLSTMFSAVAKFAAPLLGVEGVEADELGNWLIPAIAIVVMLYGVLGGLRAAYVTDLVQGLFIIALSVMLIPLGLKMLAETAGGGGVLEGFRALHRRLPADYFELFGGPAAGEFPVEYVISLTLLAFVGIVVQPQFITTGGGSAKTEETARVGLVVGNFLKRLCTVGWAITALIALALFAGNAEIAADPDRVWGVASREILGPLGIGLVGLMLSCLLAAVMSSADTYMLVTSAVVVRNLYVPYVNPAASERDCLRVARWTGGLIIAGASAIAMTYADVFAQFTMALEIPLLFAAPFWVGMYWRRATTTAVWLTMGTVALLFFVLPHLLPATIPSLRTGPALTGSTHRITTTTVRPATEADVERRDAWEALPDAAREKAIEPPAATLGEPLEVVMVRGDRSIFFPEGVTPEGEPRYVQISDETEETANGYRNTLVERRVSPATGTGPINADFLLYGVLGVDLDAASKGTLEAARLPLRLLLPFLLMIGFSLITQRNSEAALDRFYAKMNTPVRQDPEEDTAELAKSYADPRRFDGRKLFPRSDWEFVRPTAYDIGGFLACVAGCVAVIWLLVWLAGIGG